MIMFYVLIVVLVFVPSFGIPLKECSSFTNCEKCANGTDWLGGRCDWCTLGDSCESMVFNSCPMNKRVGLKYNCPRKLPSGVNYDEQFAKEKAFPLIAASNEDNRERMQKILNCHFRKAEVGSLFHVPCDLLNTTSCFAYTVVLHSEKAIAVVFRGSKGPDQILQQAINLFLTKAMQPFHPTGGRVYDYYHQSFYRLWDSKIALDLTKYGNLLPEYDVWSFGHSLGGGLASLAAATIVGNGIRPSSKVKMISFGQPRIGDRSFAEGHDKLVPESFRIINGQDPIPSFPSLEPIGSPFEGAYHHRFEVWYPSGMEPKSEYRISHMAEDRSAFGGNIQFSPEQHVFYFGQDLRNWANTTKTC